MTSKSNKASPVGSKHAPAYSSNADLFLPAISRKASIPLQIIRLSDADQDMRGLDKAETNWLNGNGWSPRHGHYACLPNENGALGRVVIALDMEDLAAGSFALGALARALPENVYHFALPEEGLFAGDEGAQQNWLFHGALAWALGAYRFENYKSGEKAKKPQLKLSAGIAPEDILAIADPVLFGRDLINIPANDLGPQELEIAAQSLAKHYKAKTKAVRGEELLEQNFPMIHAVGRASDRDPRLIEINWGKKADPKITLVGKGICFDTGGLNLKPGNAMALMKKDMGGSAAALSLAGMIMAAQLPVCLRVLIPAADNNVSANAFRPGDVLQSRAGLSVEIGNTDAEGRLVLADALALADEEEPEYIFNFATLTGAARVAMGPDLPPFYCDDDEVAERLSALSMDVADPIWRLPLWKPYDANLSSAIADVNHISDGPFAGSITAALFLKRFVTKAQHFLHFDIYGWVPSDKPAHPKGGEVQAVRAVFAFLQQTYSAS